MNLGRSLKELDNLELDNQIIFDTKEKGIGQSRFSTLLPAAVWRLNAGFNMWLCSCLGEEQIVDAFLLE